MEMTLRSYLPAAGHDWLLPLYDVITKLMGADRARKALLDGVAITPGQRILDIGCGTGTLAVMLKSLHPAIEVVGLDPDPKALARARRKAERSAVSPRFDQGFSDALPYPQASFQHVFSSFMFHHLEDEQKQPTLREVRRVLTPGGHLHLLDFSAPGSSHRGPFSRLHQHKRLRENTPEHILGLMRHAGLVDATMVGHRTLLAGLAQVAYYRASAPERG